MLIYVFPPHYQLVYINLNISSFSVISYNSIQTKTLLYSCTNTVVFFTDYKSPFVLGSSNR